MRITLTTSGGGGPALGSIVRRVEVTETTMALQEAARAIDGTAPAALAALAAGLDEASTAELADVAIAAARFVPATDAATRGMDLDAVLAPPVHDAWCTREAAHEARGMSRF